MSATVSRFYFPVMMHTFFEAGSKFILGWSLVVVCDPLLILAGDISERRNKCCYLRLFYFRFFILYVMFKLVSCTELGR